MLASEKQMKNVNALAKVNNPMYACSLPGDACIVWRGSARKINFARARFINGAWKLEYAGPMATASKRKSVQEPMASVHGAPLLFGSEGEPPEHEGEWPGLVNVLKQRLNLDLCPPKSSTVKKGKDGEREIAAVYRKWFGDETSVERNLDQHKNGGGDLVGPGLLGWYVEVKRCERGHLPGWKRQCDKGAPDPQTPVAIWWRKNGQPWKIYTRINGQWADDPVGEDVIKISHFIHGQST